MESAVGTPATMVFDGKTIEFSPLELKKVLGVMSDWLRSRELSAKIDGWMAMLERGLLTKDDMLVLVDRFNEQAVTDALFSFGGPRMTAILEDFSKGEDGIKKHMDFAVKLVSALTGLSEADVIKVVTEKPTQVAAMLGYTAKAGLPNPKSSGPLSSEQEHATPAQTQDQSTVVFTA